MLWVLRDELKLTATKYGCGIAQCGACTVHLNGMPRRSCVAPVSSVQEADWSQMRAEGAPANNDLYKNLAFGIQGTGGSTAVANSYEQMRKAGATARALLVAAAAQTWKVPASESDSSPRPQRARRRRRT